MSKVRCAVFPEESLLKMICNQLTGLRSKVDALIISDLGVFMLAKELLPEMTLHVSTQASVVSSRTCIEWHKLGASRVILARELSLDEIKRMCDELFEARSYECRSHIERFFDIPPLLHYTFPFLGTTDTAKSVSSLGSFA